MSDSRLASAVGYAPWFLDVLDAEWAAERLPTEEFLAAPGAGAAAGELPLVLDADGEELFAGGVPAAERDLQWAEPGTDLLDLEEQQNEAFALTTAQADFARATRDAAAASASAAAAARDATAAAAAAAAPAAAT